MSKIMDTQNCFHCGLDVIKAEEIILTIKILLQRLQTIFSVNDLTCYYDFEKSRATPLDIKGKYDFRKRKYRFKG
jgi:Cu+-exporting ATPase